MEFIICEREPHWGPLMRETCRARGAGLTVRETRHADYVAERLAFDRPAAVLLQVNGERLLAAARFLARQQTDWPRVRTIIALEPDARFARQTLIELGAAGVVTGLRQANEVARLARRHAARYPRVAGSVIEEFADYLPWPEESK